MSIVERFYSKVDRSEGCWIWTGSKTKFGYGKLGIGGGWRLAHRVAYELSYGAIPSGMCVCHRCDIPYCVRPEHLFVGTHKDNALDSMRKGRKYVMPIAELNERRKPVASEVARLAANALWNKRRLAREV